MGVFTKLLRSLDARADTMLVWLEAAHEDQERRAMLREQQLDELRKTLRNSPELTPIDREQLAELINQERMQAALDRIIDEQDVARRQLRLSKGTMLASVVAAVAAVAALIVNVWRG